MPIAALVLGIVGAALSLTPYLFWVGLPLSLLAVILGVASRRRQLHTRGPATVGLVLGAVGLVIGSLALTTCMFFIKSGSDLRRLVRKAPAVEAQLPNGLDGEDGADQNQDQDQDNDEPEQPPAKLREVVTFDNDSTWTVLEVHDFGKLLVDRSGDQAETEGRFLSVRVRVTSLLAENQKLDIYALPSLETGGDSIEPMEDGARFLQSREKSAVGAILRQKQSQELMLYYEVPPEAAGAKLQLEISSLDDGRDRRVDLGL
jgi:hypothetical protein